MCLENQPKNNREVCISGFGLANDAYHMTSPDPQGAGIHRAMHLALESSGLSLSNITWVHAHGTGSLANDDAEANAINSLFDGCYPLVSSTKPIHGHTLAASGVLETIVSSLGIQNNYVPATKGLDLSFTAEKQLKNMNLHLQHKAIPVQHVLKNSLGFGGANAAIILSSRNF